MSGVIEAEKVYLLYRVDPDVGKSSYLHNHYIRGRKGIMKPTPSRNLAYAAWRAGRDSVKAETLNNQNTE